MPICAHRMFSCTLRTTILQQAQTQTWRGTQHPFPVDCGSRRLVRANILVTVLGQRQRVCEGIEARTWRHWAVELDCI